MNKTILDQLDIDIAKLLGNAKGKSTLSNPIFEAKLTAAPDTTSYKAALLQINIADNTCSSQLKAALDLMDKEFAAVTIFIDMSLALLAYSIILPYMSKEQIQNIVARRKLDWIAIHMPVIKKMTIPWSIITDHEPSIEAPKQDNITKLHSLLASSNTHIAADALALKTYLAAAHNIVPAQYQQEQHNYDAMIEQYLITKTATIDAIQSCSHYEYVYIAPHAMCSYNYLKQTLALQHLPPCLTLSFTKIAENNEKKLLTSTELNHQLHDLGLLGKISERKSYLENSVKNFPGNVYLQLVNCTLLTCNKQHALTLGVPDESYLAGKTFENILPQDEVDKITAIVEEITTENATKVLIEHGEILGKRLPFLSIKMPLRNKKNKTIGIIGFSLKMKDKNAIEEFKNSKPKNLMQTIMAESTKQLRANNMQAIAAGAPTLNNDTTSLIKAIEHMPGHVFWQDNKGNILGCNHNLALFLGYDSTQEIIGKNSSDFLTDEHALESRKSLAIMVATGKPISKEEKYQSKNSFLRMISYKTPVKDNNGKIIGIMVVAINIQENTQREIQLRQEKEQLEITNNLKNKFIETIGHDMRAPILDLYNLTELCAEQETDPAKKQRLHKISNCAKDLLKFSSNVSEASHKYLVAVKDVTNSIISSNIDAIQTKRLKVKLDYDNNIPDTVVGHPYKVKKTLNKLMSNAIKNSTQGYITLVIKLESHQGTELAISFTTLESGVGITEEEQRYIFSKYNMLNCNEV